MPKYTYTALTKDKKTVTSSADAVSKEALIDSLKHQDLFPLLIKKQSSINLSLNLTSKKVSSKNLVVFTRQLSTMISAGVAVNKALSTLEQQSEDGYFKQVITDVSKNIESGQTIASALSKYPNVFSDVYINMVRAGEAGGILDDILKRLASQLEKEASMRKKIKSAMMYPVAIGVITVIAFLGIMLFVMPRIASMLQDIGGPDAKMPIYTQIMLDVSGFVQDYIVFIVILFVIASIFIGRYIRTANGKYKYHSLLLKIPIINNVITKIAVARFSRTFASLMSAGVGVLEALEVTGGAIGNKVIEKELKDSAEQVKNGKTLSQTLAKSQHFPMIISQMLAVGEETGQIDTVLIKVADFYEEEVDTLIEGLSSLIEPIMIVVLGAGVGLIAASVMGPIASLSKNIGS